MNTRRTGTGSWAGTKERRPRGRAVGSGRSRRRTAVLLAWLAAQGWAAAQIDIRGVQDKGIYADSVTLRVVTETGYAYEAYLNGEAVALDEPVDAGAPQYYELDVTRTDLATSAEETRVVRFVVRASERGNTETGLPPWTPLPLIPSAADEFAGTELVLVVPEAFPAGHEIPVICLVENGEGRRAGVNGTAAVGGAGGVSFPMLRGVGSSRLPAASGGGDLDVRVDLSVLSASRTIAVDAATSWSERAGTVGADADWAEAARIRLAGNLTVAAGATLTVGAGSVILAAPGADIEVEGTLVIEGTLDRPVVFLPESPGAPWGGLLFRSSASRATIAGAIFTGSGADPDWFDNNPGNGHSHRDEQPLLFVSNGARVTVTDSFIVDNAGQAGHGEDGTLTLVRCLIQRCITAGQYNGGTLTVDRCALLEFPSADAPFADADNDALYLIGGGHSVTDSLLGWLLDDAIDAGASGGESVTFARCWIESTYHEAFAMSRDLVPRIEDCVAINCGQGIECGYGSPRVDATRCLSTANCVGARFADNYDWDYDGFLEVTDSLLLYNKMDIWGRNWSDWEERLSQMDLHDNLLTAPDPLHPANRAWDPASDAARLRPFLPAVEGLVGIGIALRDDQVDGAAVAGGVPVRLSTFTTHPVTVEYRVESSGGGLGGGTLRYAPGETVRWIDADTGGLAGNETLQVVLHDPAGGELTGRTEVLVVPDPKVPIVPPGAVWKYMDRDFNLGTTWRDPTFDDSSWPEGPAELGYGDGDEATVIDGGSPGDHHPTEYFRRSVEIVDPAAFEKFEVRLLKDDGAVVYLNGGELFRSNMPGGSIGYGTWAASTTSSEDTFETREVPSGRIVAGTNVLAVEVHQASASSSDLSFALELVGYRRFAPLSGFVRGDSNGDGGVDVSDAVMTLLALFAGGFVDCEDALDADDSGDLDITDVIYSLNYLFLSGPVIPAPYPGRGEDPTSDALDCDRG